MGVLSLLATVATLLHACQLPDMAAGDLLATFAYVRLYGTGLGQVPLLVGHCSRLNDIVKRL
jgi:hypothetical protein